MKVASSQESTMAKAAIRRVLLLKMVVSKKVSSKLGLSLGWPIVTPLLMYIEMAFELIGKSKEMATRLKYLSKMADGMALSYSNQ